MFAASAVTSVRRSPSVASTAAPLPCTPAAEAASKESEQQDAVLVARVADVESHASALRGRVAAARKLLAEKLARMESRLAEGQRVEQQLRARLEALGRDKRDAASTLAELAAQAEELRVAEQKVRGCSVLALLAHCFA
jgi:chromosome segregation ATPase